MGGLPPNFVVPYLSLDYSRIEREKEIMRRTKMDGRERREQIYTYI